MEAFYVVVGVILGSIITWYARALEIDKALNTVGIKRKEHVAHKKQTEAIEAEIEALKDRVSLLTAGRSRST